MDYVGRAVRDHEATGIVPCIAVSPYQMVTHKELLEVRESDMVVNYRKKVPNSGHGAALEPNHSHFVLVYVGWCGCG